jgi:hypothetical protein
MDIDTTSSNTPLQTSTLKQTANDSMHAQLKNDNMFEDTGFDYELPPVKGKKKQTWFEELELYEGSHDQEIKRLRSTLLLPLRTFSRQTTCQI